MSGRKKLFYWGMVIGALLGIATFIAIPDFLKTSHHPPVQYEAKRNLGAIFTAQVAYFGENGAYAGGKDCFELIQWAPEGENRYSYYCGGDVLKNTKGDECPIPDVKHGVSDSSFTVMAVGNVDKDPTCDVWIMNDAKVIKVVVNDLAD